MGKLELVRSVMHEIGGSIKQDPYFQLLATPSRWPEEIRNLPAVLREANEIVYARDPIFRLLNITLGRFVAAACTAAVSAPLALVAGKFLEESVLEDFYGESISPGFMKHCNHMAEGFGAAAVVGMTVAASLIVVPAAINLIKEWRRPDSDEGNGFVIG